ncbi:MAG: leucine-rich repeat domain-containing protein, partial [Bifidobacteriaceae bacterium]|nr:leucine-rich repeat domain-containing protein [Bifidobacteriaceae bacterium]
MSSHKNLLKLIGIGSALTLAFASLVGISPAKFITTGSPDSAKPAAAVDLVVPDPQLVVEIQDRIFGNNPTETQYEPWTRTTKYPGSDLPSNVQIIESYDGTISQGSIGVGTTVAPTLPYSTLMQVFTKSYLNNKFEPGDASYSWYWTNNQEGVAYAEQSSALESEGGQPYIPLRENFNFPPNGAVAGDFTQSWFVWNDGVGTDSGTYTHYTRKYNWNKPADVPLNSETAPLLTGLSITGTRVYNENTRSYDYFSGKITTLAGLNQFPELAYISVVDQTISSFDNAWVAGLPKLNSLNISSNWIQTLTALDNLPATLTNLSFRNNQITAIPAISGLPALTTIYLEGNKITEVPANAFAGVPTLTSLNLNFNDIQTIAVGAFNGVQLGRFTGASTDSAGNVTPHGSGSLSIGDQTVSQLGIRDSFPSPISYSGSKVPLYDFENIAETGLDQYGLTASVGSASFYRTFKNVFSFQYLQCVYKYANSSTTTFYGYGPTSTSNYPYTYPECPSNLYSSGDNPLISQELKPGTDSSIVNFNGDFWGHKASPVIVKLPADDGPAYKFTDVSAKKVGSKTRADAINWLAKTGVTVGSGCNKSGAGKNCKFLPKNKVNRGAMAQFLAKLAGMNDTSLAEFVKPLPNKFTDLKSLQSGKGKNPNRVNAIIWLANTGITSGCNTAGTQFCPSNAVNRGSMAQFMQRFANVPNVASETSSFPDVTVAGANIKYGKSKKATAVLGLPTTRIGAINWLAETKITVGSQETTIAKKPVKTFRPQDAVTRGA